jgi:hypothetical protein
MNIIILLIMFCAISSISTNGCAADMAPNPDTIAGYAPPAPNEVQIAFSGVDMPLGRLLLIRKDSRYCAVKFTRFWTEKAEKEKFAAYEVYCKEDGTGDFSNKNVKITEGKASLLRPRGPFYPLKWQPGNPEVKCGPLKLLWAYKGIVCFFERSDSPGDYGVELAPTPWSDISQVNVLDPRVKWYRYDEQRKRINIPIDKLWKDQ